MSLSARIRFEGANGATTATDESGLPKTITFSGSAAISTAQVIEGTSSLKLARSTLDYVRVTATGTELNMGAGDYTLSLWIYLGAGNPDGATIFSGLTSRGPYIFLNGTNTISVGVPLGPSGASQFANNQSKHPLNTWQCYGLTRQNGVSRFFVNGYLVAIQQPSAPANELVDLTTFDIGRYPVTAGYQFEGFVDDIFIDKGVALWTQRYDPYTLTSLDNTFTSQLIDSPLTLFAQSVNYDIAPIAIAQPFKLLDYYDEGLGRVYGTTKIKGSPDYPVGRKVRLIRDIDGRVVRETWSDPVTGAYEFNRVRTDVRYTVLAYDYNNTFRAVVADNLIAEPIL